MDPERWRQIETLFQETLQLASADRSAFLATTCKDDAELRAEIESLLQADAESDVFVDAVRRHLDTLRPADEAPPAWVGRRLGPYTLVREIGRGGMGTVYVAARADDEYRQLVAVKVVEAGAEVGQLLAQLRRERQILADLDHPYIARLIDGGSTAEGIPYLVMEYVEGEPIDVYCDRRRLSIGNRLELFRRVAEAVQFAHRALIVHRDLKPANILVTAEGVPKLLDFGIAKLLEPNEREAAAQQTRPWLRRMSLLYASPEQVQDRPITTASDVYSLGVLLYKILTGLTPYRVNASAAPELVAAICHQESLRPSSAVERAAKLKPDNRSGKPTTTLEAIASERSTPPRQLVRQLSGDLDAIVQKALAKEPEHRYPSVHELSEDLRRHLEGRPVRARQDAFGWHSTFGWRGAFGYRAAKFLRRNKLAVSLAAGLVAALLALAIVATVLAVRTAGERDRIAVEQRKARETADFLIELFESADPAQSRGSELTVREILVQGAARLDHQLGTQPEVQGALLHTIGTVYRNLGIYEEGARLLERAIAERREVFGREHPEVASSLHALALLESERGEFARSANLHAEALDIRRKTLPPDDPALAQSLRHNAWQVRLNGGYEEAEALLQEALTLLRTAPGDHQLDIATVLHDLGSLLYERRRLIAAEKLLQEAYEIESRRLGEDHPLALTAAKNLAGTLTRLDRTVEAEALYRQLLARELRVFGESHQKLAFTYSGLGLVLERQGAYDAAEEMLRRALELRREVFGEAHPATVVSCGFLGAFYHHRGELALAEEVFDQGYAVAYDVFPPSAPQLARFLTLYGSFLIDRGRLTEAEKLLRQALAIHREASKESSTDQAEAASAMGGLRTSQGRYAEAEDMLLESYRFLAARPGSAVAAEQALGRLVALYEAWSRPVEADEHRALLEKSLGMNDAIDLRIAR